MTTRQRNLRPWEVCTRITVAREMYKRKERLSTDKLTSMVRNSKDDKISGMPWLTRRDENEILGGFCQRIGGQWQRMTEILWRNLFRKLFCLKNSEIDTWWDHRKILGKLKVWPKVIEMCKVLMNTSFLIRAKSIFRIWWQQRAEKTKPSTPTRKQPPQTQSRNPIRHVGTENRRSRFARTRHSKNEKHLSKFLDLERILKELLELKKLVYVEKYKCCIKMTKMFSFTLAWKCLFLHLAQAPQWWDHQIWLE